MRWWCLVVVLVLVACDEPGTEGSMDGSLVCASAADCDDGLFCNGAETCAPGTEAANARGCVAGARPCPTTGCVELEMRCDSDCPDADGDGFADAICGGSDCDDADGNRYPGHPEYCDFKDDDCDPSTLGDRDADGDGVVSALCCNGLDCGGDCDDTNPAVGPTSPEVCNGIDDDCDGSVDEGVLIMAWPDSDRDGWGDESSSVELRCDLPSDRASRGGDCADLDATRHPEAPDVCDGIDQDCDGAMDEGADALCDTALGAATVGACVSPPDGSAPRCHGLRCVGSTDSCGASDNRCDQNLCSSQTACGACGVACLSCNGNGRCPGGGVGNYLSMVQYLDGQSGAPIAGAVVSPAGSCSTDPYATTGADGRYTLSLGFPEDPAPDGLRAVASGYPDVLVGFQDFPNPVRALSAAVLDAAYAARGLTRDPELGLLVVEGSAPVTDAISGPAFRLRPDGSAVDVADGGGGLVVFPNVLPGDYAVSPLPEGCTSPSERCQRLDGVSVEGGVQTFLSFTCEAFGCVG